MRGGGDVGEAEALAGEEAAPLGEPADVVEVVADVGVAGAHRRRVRLAQPEEALEHLLAVEVVGHLAREFAVEPRGEAARLGALARVLAEQPRLGSRLLEVLADRRRVAHRRAVVVDEHRHGARRVEGEVLGPPLPRLLDAQLGLDALLAQDNADLARERAQPEVVESGHDAAATLVATRRPRVTPSRTRRAPPKSPPRRARTRRARRPARRRSRARHARAVRPRSAARRARPQCSPPAAAARGAARARRAGATPTPRANAAGPRGRRARPAAARARGRRAAWPGRCAGGRGTRAAAAICVRPASRPRATSSAARRWSRSRAGSAP